jgi:hypothetical protein
VTSAALTGTGNGISHLDSCRMAAIAQAEVERFPEQGFVVVRGLLGAGELEALQRETMTLVERATHLSDDPDFLYKAQELTGERVPSGSSTSSTSRPRASRCSAIPSSSLRSRSCRGPVSSRPGTAWSSSSRAPARARLPGRPVGTPPLPLLRVPGRGGRAPLRPPRPGVRAAQAAGPSQLPERPGPRPARRGRGAVSLPLGRRRADTDLSLPARAVLARRPAPG